MAKAKIELKCKKCGCEFVHTREFMKRSEANNYEEWAKENIKICSKCRKDEKDNNEVAKALEILKSYPALCELNGTEKQVAWANKIRAKIASELVQLSKRPEKIFAYINAIKDASWWIENREYFDCGWRTAINRLCEYYTTGK